MANTWQDYGREWLKYQGFGVPPTWGDAELAAYGQKMAAIQQQGQSGGQQTQAGYGQQGPQGQGQWGNDIDWGDPEHIGRTAREFQQAIEQLRREQQEAQQTFYELFRITHELNDLEREGLYAHTQYKSDFDRRQVAEHMLQNNLNDPRKAWEALRAPQREQQGYARGRQEVESEYRARGRSMPQTVTKSHDRREGGTTRPPWGSDERRDEILGKIYERTGLREESGMMPSTQSIPGQRPGGSDPGSGGSGQPPPNSQHAA